MVEEPTPTTTPAPAMAPVAAPETPPGSPASPASPPTPTPPPPSSPEWYGRTDAPWSTTTYQRWVDEIDAAPWHTDDTGDWKALPCPRCTHTMSVILRPGLRADREPRTPARCDCDTDKDVHAGRPEDRKRGCGQSGWVMKPSDTAPATPVPPGPATRPVTEDDERWITEAADARHKSLERIQATSDAWSKSIGLVLGAFALVAFIKGPETLKDLPLGSSATLSFGQWQFELAGSVVTLIFAAAVVVALAVFSAAIASQGVPGWNKRLDGPTYQKRVTRATRNARWLLWISRILTLIGTVLLFAALAVAWQGSLIKLAAATPSAQSAIVTVAGAAPRCGTVASARDGTILFAVGQAGPAALPPEAQVTFVAACP